MFYKRPFINRVTVILLAVFMLTQHDYAQARGDHGRRSHPHFRKAARCSCTSVFPLFGGLAYLYLHNQAHTRRHDTTYIIMPQTVAAETLKISIPNSNGSFTVVKLTKSGSGYIGPQGEYYPGHPSVDQLRVLYGK
jgi:hypothetical protein